MRSAVAGRAITGVPEGRSSSSVRAFPGVVAVGVDRPRPAWSARYEVILSAANGKPDPYLRRLLTAAPSGRMPRAVIVGTRTVTPTHLHGPCALARSTGRPRRPGALPARRSMSPRPASSVSGSRVPALRGSPAHRGDADRAPGAWRLSGDAERRGRGGRAFAAADGVRAYTVRPVCALAQACAVLELAEAARTRSTWRRHLADRRRRRVPPGRQPGPISVASSLYWVSMAAWHWGWTRTPWAKPGGTA